MHHHVVLHSLIFQDVSNILRKYCRGTIKSFRGVSASRLGGARPSGAVGNQHHSGESDPGGEHAQANDDRDDNGTSALKELADEHGRGHNADISGGEEDAGDAPADGDVALGEGEGGSKERGDAQPKQPGAEPNEDGLAGPNPITTQANTQMTKLMMRMVRGLRRTAIGIAMTRLAVNAPKKTWLSCAAVLSLISKALP